ncbi:DEAD/DEAH box helicase family protein [Candidatus Woesearchaeota archaeon]|nr:DEAD/DEAH box helicase family protein [Candidatus Woesearchaeota archaeon]
MEIINISKKNEVYIQIDSEASTAQEICDHFTFMVPGYTFMPSYRNRMWDGKIRLFNVRNRLLYGGLFEHLCKFLYTRDYKVKFDSDFNNEKIKIKKDFIDSLKLPVIPRDYQMIAANHALSHHKTLLLSPTASGKSLIIYIILRYLNLKTLILVPTTSLVSQMYNDFREYGFDVANNCHTVFAGRDKGSELPIIISTWQSIYKMQQKYFEQYELVIGDEAHGFKSKSLTSIMTKCINAKYRIGTTGTLDGTLTHKLVLEGLFGKVYKVTSTKKLIDSNYLSPFTIKSILIRHPDSICHDLRNISYQEELDYLVNSEARNTFIKNLVLDLKTNTLLLFRFVEKHGKLLYDMIKEESKDRTVFFVHGGTDADTREQIRHIVESERDSIIVASYGVFSVGINIRNLHNIVFASPSKSRIRNLQSIGRALRKSENKDIATLYDIADDLSYGSSFNYTLDHFEERKKIYKEEKFDIAEYFVQLKT